MQPTTTPPNPEQAAGRSDRREPWLRVFQDGFAPYFSDIGLELMRKGLEEDDPRIIQGHTTYPPPLLCIHKWECEKADIIGYCELASYPKTEIFFVNVGMVEAFFAKACYACDKKLGEPHGCRPFLNWFDDTPREEMRRNLIAAIDGILEQRNPEDKINAELHALCTTHTPTHASLIGEASQGE